MESLTDVQQLGLLLGQSIEQYTHIRLFLQRMDQELGSASPAAMMDMNGSFADLQDQALETDRILLDRINRNPALSEKARSLLETRQALLQEVLLLNRRAMEKATGIKCLLGHELGTVRNGIAAMSGYRQPRHNQGRIFSGTT